MKCANILNKIYFDEKFEISAKFNIEQIFTIDLLNTEAI